MSAVRIACLLVLAAAAAPAVQAQERRVYPFERFDRIEVSGLAKVELEQGDHDDVIVRGDDSLQRNVQLSVVGTQLRVRMGENWKFWNREPVQMTVRLRELRQLTISGASEVRAPGPFRTDRLVLGISGEGSVRFDDLSADSVRFEVSGAGDGELAGQVSELRLDVSGKGRLTADHLRTARASVSISGIGNADVWVTDQLKVSVSGIGTVNYWGSPQVQRSTSGMAMINARGERR